MTARTSGGMRLSAKARKADPREVSPSAARFQTRVPSDGQTDRRPLGLLPGPEDLHVTRLATLALAHQDFHLTIRIHQVEGRPAPNRGKHHQALRGQAGGEIFPGLYFIFQ